MSARLARSFIVAATLSTALIAFADDARACSCAGPDPALTRLANSDAVFRGTVIEIEVPWALRPGADGQTGFGRDLLAELSDASVIAVLEVHESWKGVHTREVELDLGDGACCNCTLGAGFVERGEELLVYAYEHEGKLTVSFCNLPVRSEYMGSHLEVLGPGELALAPGRTQAKRSRTFIMVVATFFVLALVLLLLFRARPGSAQAERD